VTNQAAHKVSPGAVILDNAKLVAMYGLGAWLIFPTWPVLGWIYLAYCALSLLFYIRFICPYCFRYHAGTCLSGYHIFAQVFKPQEPGKFATQFKRYVAVLFPAWFLPPLAGVYLLITNFSWLVIVQVVLFCLVAFVILPYISGKHSCKECENAENCPWRKG